MLRKAVAAETPLGAKVKETMERGELVSDDLINDVVRERMQDPDALEGFILDGYPRNRAQAHILDEILDEQGIKLDKVIKFMVTGDEIVSRLAGRWECPVCHTVYHAATHPPKVEGICDNEGAALVQRKDDTKEAVLTRLEEYGQQTKQLYDLYEDRGLLESVDAIGAADEVFQRLLEAIGA
jgi:adenylate kinase